MKIQAKIILFFSCKAKDDYHYCKFRSPAGDECDFYKNSASGMILEEFCDSLKERTVFSGVFQDHECALLVKGAKHEDEGHWRCEVGTRRTSDYDRHQPWTMLGDIHIQVLQHNETSTSGLFEELVEEEGFAGVIKANTTLLVICIVVFVIFLSILLCVVIMFGRSRLHKSNFFARKKPETNEDEMLKEETKTSGDFSFLRKVMPHIIKFPSKDS